MKEVQSGRQVWRLAGNRVVASPGLAAKCGAWPETGWPVG